MEKKKQVASIIPGYTYGASEAAHSPITLADLERLKKTMGFTQEDERYLKMAGELLQDHTKELVDIWRGAIGRTPHLARHSKDPQGNPIPSYSADSGLRLQQWILDTCFRPYDQDWLNYQQEIALRHMSIKKNATDKVHSTPFIPLRDIIAFTAFMNDTIKPFLASKQQSAAEIEKMHSAWCKSLQLQIALWAQPYSSQELSSSEW